MCLCTNNGCEASIMSQKGKTGIPETGSKSESGNSTLDQKIRDLTDWLEDITTMQRVNVVLLITTFMVLAVHMILDIFFHV